MTHRVAIIGSVGVPASYGGFETLAQNLVDYHAAHDLDIDLTVYCSRQAYAERPSHYGKAKLRYVPLNANGVQSIPYDIWCVTSAVMRGADSVLVLGVSGALAIPFFRLVSRSRFIVNIDGMEWRRQKWGGLAKRTLRWFEKLAVKYAHEVIADNAAISDYVREHYGRESRVIAYGGDHAIAVPSDAKDAPELPEAFSIALSRIEPENNVEMILEAFAQSPKENLVYIGNWKASAFGEEMIRRYSNRPNIRLQEPIYDVAKLRHIREKAARYIHGHSAGGTNPALVEMMHFGIPVLAFDCSFNRYTTEESASYFGSVSELKTLLAARSETTENGAEMQKIALKRYTWAIISQAYFALMPKAR